MCTFPKPTPYSDIYKVECPLLPAKSEQFFTFRKYITSLRLTWDHLVNYLFQALNSN